MGQNIPRFDYWEHVPATTDYPTGGGGRTATAGQGQTAGSGKKVLLHSITRLTTGTDTFNILRGDGVTNYFTVALQPPTVGFTEILDIELSDGLAVSGGTTGIIIIEYRLLK